jgi:hypothetical protein
VKFTSRLTSRRVDHDPVGANDGLLVMTSPSSESCSGRSDDAPLA